jgi:hypothetical protein
MQGFRRVPATHRTVELLGHPYAVWPRNLLFFVADATLDFNPRCFLGRHGRLSLAQARPAMKTLV